MLNKAEASLQYQTARHLGDPSAPLHYAQGDETESRLRHAEQSRSIPVIPNRPAFGSPFGSIALRSGDETGSCLRHAEQSRSIPAIPNRPAFERPFGSIALRVAKRDHACVMLSKAEASLRYQTGRHWGAPSAPLHCAQGDETESCSRRAERPG